MFPQSRLNVIFDPSDNSIILEAERPGKPSIHYSLGIDGATDLRGYLDRAIKEYEEATHDKTKG